MRLPVTGNGAQKNRRKLRIAANLGVERIDEPANALLGNPVELLVEEIMWRTPRR